MCSGDKLSKKSQMQYLKKPYRGMHKDKRTLTCPNYVSEYPKMQYTLLAVN